MIEGIESAPLPSAAAEPFEGSSETRPTWTRGLICNRVALRTALAILLLALLVYFANPADIVSKLRQVPLWFVAFGWVLYSVCQLISSWKWQVLLRARGCSYPLLSLFNLYMIGMFCNNFLPGSVGGDVVKASGLYLGSGQGSLSVASVLLERFLGLAALAIIGLVASGFIGLDAPGLITLCTFSAAGLMGAVALLMWSPFLFAWSMKILARIVPRRILQPIASVAHVLHDYRRHRGVLAFGLLLSIVIQALIAGYYWACAWVLEIDVGGAYFFAFLPILTLIAIVPISIGGMGVKEAGMVALFSAIGISAADVLAISITVHAINTVLSFYGGAALMLRRRSKSAEGARFKQAQSRDEPDHSAGGKWSTEGLVE